MTVTIQDSDIPSHISPELDFSSELFNPSKALSCKNLHLPCPKSKTYNNLAEYYSHTFGKKKSQIDPNQSNLRVSKDQHYVLNRNYAWYYSTLGLDCPDDLDARHSYMKCYKRKQRSRGKYKVDKNLDIKEMPPEMLLPIRSDKLIVKQNGYRKKIILLNKDDKIVSETKEGTDKVNSVTNSCNTDASSSLDKQHSVFQVKKAATVPQVVKIDSKSVRTRSRPSNSKLVSRPTVSSKRSSNRVSIGAVSHKGNKVQLIDSGSRRKKRKFVKKDLQSKPVFNNINSVSNDAHNSLNLLKNLLISPKSKPHIVSTSVAEMINFYSKDKQIAIDINDSTVQISDACLSNNKVIESSKNDLNYDNRKLSDKTLYSPAKIDNACLNEAQKENVTFEKSTEVNMCRLKNRRVSSITTISMPSASKDVINPIGPTNKKSDTECINTVDKITPLLENDSVVSSNTTISMLNANKDDINSTEPTNEKEDTECMNELDKNTPGLENDSNGSSITTKNMLNVSNDVINSTRPTCEKLDTECINELDKITFSDEENEFLRLCSMEKRQESTKSLESLQACPLPENKEDSKYKKNVKIIENSEVSHNLSCKEIRNTHNSKERALLDLARKARDKIQSLRQTRKEKDVNLLRENEANAGIDVNLNNSENSALTKTNCISSFDSFQLLETEGIHTTTKLDKESDQVTKEIKAITMVKRKPFFDAKTFKDSSDAQKENTHQQSNPISATYSESKFSSNNISESYAKFPQIIFSNLVQADTATFRKENQDPQAYHSSVSSKKDIKQSSSVSMFKNNSVKTQNINHCDKSEQSKDVINAKKLSISAVKKNSKCKKGSSIIVSIDLKLINTPFLKQKQVPVTAVLKEHNMPVPNIKSAFHNLPDMSKLKGYRIPKKRSIYENTESKKTRRIM